MRRGRCEKKVTAEAAGTGRARAVRVGRRPNSDSAFTPYHDIRSVRRASTAERPVAVICGSGQRAAPGREPASACRRPPGHPCRRLRGSRLETQRLAHRLVARERVRAGHARGRGRDWRKADDDSGKDDGAWEGGGACPPLRMPRDLAAGIAVGFLTGFVGVGGGFLIVPTLAVALAFTMRTAIGTSLAIITGTSVLGLATHLGRRTHPRPRHHSRHGRRVRLRRAWGSRCWRLTYPNKISVGVSRCWSSPWPVTYWYPSPFSADPPAAE